MTQPLFWNSLAVGVVIFWVIPKIARMWWLVAISLFYLVTNISSAEGDQGTSAKALLALSLMGAWALLFYALVPVVTTSKLSKRWIVPACVLGLVGFFAYFKYFPALFASIGASENGMFIPLGISYFVFKLIHYLVESGRGKITTRSLSSFLCYVFLFPIFTAGPIERFDHFLDNREGKLTKEAVVHGLMRIILGLIKLLVILQIALIVVFYKTTKGNTYNLIHHLDQYSTWVVWFIMIGVYLKMYVGFSAYSDIAIGASRLFGLKIAENFNWPVFAPNISDFWKRWHMSLANWCMTYIYMPVLGLRRNPYLAAYVTFVVMGLWHAGAAPWVAWGLYHATGLILYQSWGRYRRKKQWRFFTTLTWKLMCIPITFAFVTGGFCFIEVHGYGGAYDGARILAKMFFVELPSR